MAAKKPGPYHIDFVKLSFGSWESDSQETQNDRAQITSLMQGMMVFQAQLLKCHEVRVLFGQNKIRYETYIAHPRGNRGRVEIDFSQVTGIQFDFEKPPSEKGYKVTVQLSTPALTYVGSQEIARFKKSNAVYESAQTDFSEGGQIKKCKSHSFTIDNLNRLKTMKLRMEQHGLATAITTGIDEALLTASFTEEEVEASFEKARGSKAAKMSKKRAVPTNENNDTGNDNNTNNDGEGPSVAAPAAASRAPAKPRKPSPKMVPGLVDSLDSIDAGPWLEKCVERWHLIAPFDPNVTDEQWEEYYRERAALDWYIKEAKGLQVEWDDDYSHGKKEYKPPAWTEEFPKPPMYAYSEGECYVENDAIQNHVESIGEALKEVISGCPQISDDLKALGEKFAGGVYVLSGFTNWDDMFCRDFDIQTRLYSPYCLATSVDFKIRWHFRQRMSFTEHSTRIDFVVRTAEDVDPLRPQRCACEHEERHGNSDRANVLYTMERADSGYMKRSLAAVGKLRAAEEALFGRKGLISDRKMFSLLMNAASSVDCDDVTKDLKQIFRLSRRKWKNFVGEEGDESDNDTDSDNESLKNIKKKRAKFGPGGPFPMFGDFPGLGGYGGEESDEEEREECTIM